MEGKNPEEETEGQSQKSKSFQCDFCETIFSSKELYVTHGQVPVSDCFPCYYTMEKLTSFEWFLRRLNLESVAETLKRSFHEESDGESAEMKLNREDFEAYINELSSSRDQ